MRVEYGLEVLGLMGRLPLYMIHMIMERESM